jgi:menaquinol-cytochrome c reductase iron-sulfur subunit
MEGDETRTAPGRRDFLSRVAIGMGALAATLAAIPVVGFILGPLLKRAPDVWRPVGPLSRFPIGSTVEAVFEDPSPEPWAGVSARTGIWLRREDETRFTGFSMHCTHLGCPVRWLQDAELFMCPCHGGVYYRDGRVAAGPPELPLRRHEVRVRNGKVEIRTRPIPIT